MQPNAVQARPGSGSHSRKRRFTARRRAVASIGMGALVGGLVAGAVLGGGIPAGGRGRPAPALAASDQAGKRPAQTGSTPSGAGSAAATTPHGLAVHSTLTAAGLNQPVVGGSTSPDGTGWWEVASDGGIFSFGTAAFHGSTGAIHLNQPIVGMTATPSGQGYWLVASDGGIFSFGDAAFHGSTGAIHLNQPIVGMTATPSGQGYWLVASDGGMFSFGDAAFRGSTGAMRLAQPIVSMTSTPSGGGYWLVASDGGIFSFGDAAFRGSSAGASPGAAVATIVRSPSGQGYWVVGRDATAHQFGDAPAVGSGASAMSAPVVGAGLAGRGLRLMAADGSSVGVTSGSPAVAAAPPAAPAAPAGNPGSYSYLVTNGDGTPARFDPCGSVHYVTNLAEAPAGAAQVVAGALSRITAASGVSFVDDGPTTEIPTSSRAALQPARYGNRWAPVVIAWTHASQSDVLGSGDIIGEGGSSWVAQTGGPKVYVTGEVAIDADRTSAMAAGFGDGNTLGELLLHELGHVMGLGHTSDPNQIMYPTLMPVSAAAYGAGDLTGLAHLGRQAGCLTTPTP